MSADRLHTYKLLAELCEYPTSRTPATAKLCAMFLEDRCPEAATHIRALLREVERADVRELQERYSAVFDFAPTRTLDLGYQLFGETYKRGAFLVNMVMAARKHEVDPATGMQIGVKGLIADPQLPFFVQWLTPPELHPSAGADGEYSLYCLEIGRASCRERV